MRSSAKGLKLAQDIMRLNHTLGELNNNNFEDYGERDHDYADCKWVIQCGGARA